TTRIFEIKCPTDLEVIARGESALVQWELPQLVETSCDDQSIQIQQLQGQLSGSTFEVGEYEIEYLVQDACGQAARCLFEVKVLADTTRIFEIKCPTDLEVIARGESALVQWELPQLVETSCDDQNIRIRQVLGQPSGSSFEVGEYEIEYIVKDDCGQEATCLFEIRVLEDTTEQVFSLTCPEDIYATVPVFGATVNIEWEEPSVSVPCEAGYTLRRIRGIPSGSKFTVGIAKITYQLKDRCGNESRCSFNIIVEIAPNIHANSTNNTNNFSTLFPNPFKDHLQLKCLPTASDAQLHIYDALGKLVVTQALTVEKSTYDFSTVEWKAGYYFWCISSEKGITESGKLICVKSVE
ncbi:MAG: HYR domain-containing protein, partial [Bacteroidota bacterium]